MGAMGKAAKTIIEGLKAAKVSAADQGRAKHLIDEAYDWDAAQAGEVEAVVRYVCGVGELPKTITKSLLENHGAELLRGLSKGRKLDGWDLRALDVIVRAKKAYWFWELDSWLRDRVEKFAAEPIFDEALSLFRARGLWADDAAIIASMVGHLNAHVTDKGALTSTGRWLLAKIDRDAKSVFAVARAQKEDETSSLYRLLLAHRRELFEKLIPKLALKADSDRSYLAEKLLEADAKRYEKQVLALLAPVKAPYPAMLSANNLEKHFPGKYRPEVKRLLLATIKGKSHSILFANEATDTHEVAIELAWRALGEEAFELWNAYKEENDAVRVGFYATIVKQAKAKALPWLIDGLVYPKDPNVEYGGLNHAKYVQRVLELLAPYDLTPYHERIEKAFAKTTSKKVREQIDAVLGRKAKGKGAAPTKKTSPFAGTDGYRFETYVAAITKAALAQAKKHKKRMPSPIEQVKLGGMQGDVQLNVLLIEGVGEPVELALSVPKSRVPAHVDLTDDDKVLPKFTRLHGLGSDGDDDEVPMWGDMFKLPWCVLLHEQIVAAQAIADALKKQGFKLAKGCKVGVGEDDNFFQSARSFEKMSRQEVAALPEAQQADFAAVCFQDAKKQRWLRAR